jgi:hypothetical protein
MATFVVRNVCKINAKKNLWLLTRHISCQKPNYTNRPLHTPQLSNYVMKRFKTTKTEQETDNNEPTPSQKSPTLQQKLKQAVAQYGSTVIVFHVGISLMSLGISYVLVSSGLEVEKYMLLMGISGETASKIATGAGTFAVAYAVHKLFAPARIMVTLTATPFIVRYLRHIGVIKQTK